MIKSNCRNKNTSVHLETKEERINLRGNHFYLYTQQEEKETEKYLYIKCNDVRKKTKDIVEEAKQKKKKLFGKEAKFY